MNDEAEFILAAGRAESGEPDQAGPVNALGAKLIGEFHQAELDRQLTEQRWLRDIRQYKGQYTPEEEAAIGPKRSRAFVRKTRVKVKTVDSRVADLLFPAGSEKNWDLSSTPRPSISKEQRSLIKKQLQQLAKGAPIPQEAVDDAVQAMAKESAKAMAKVIDDQLVEARYKQTSLKAIHSAHLYGTGIVKGPLVERKVRTRFEQQGDKWVSKSETYVVPFVDYVPVWRFYPDMQATELGNCRYVWERHTFSQSDLVELSGRRSFNSQRIVDYIRAHPDGQVQSRYWDNELKVIGIRIANQGLKVGQFEVLERWGWLSGAELHNAGCKVDAERMHEAFFSNVWMLPNGDVIKAALQPINGVTWPYHIYYFDKDETSIFGEGIPSIMADDQAMLNAATRMIIDNAGVTAGAMLEIAPHLLTRYERLDEIHPWKVWIRNTQHPGERAVKAVELPSKTAELTSMAQMFENNADEVTAIPRYMSGENIGSGAAGTASGMSMLMGAANIVIKDLISAWDEGVTIPFISALYRWNMQWHKDPRIKGDYDVQARGTASLVAKEVRARTLLEFGASVANELDAPYIKRDALLRQRAEATELAGVVKTEEEVQAETNNEAQQQQAQLQQQLQALQMQELQAKVEKVMADAKKAMADAELIKARAISDKVEAVYASMQAAGVAMQSPHIAPAADEILKSSGWQDRTTPPGIADLMGQSVQGQDVFAPEESPMTGVRQGIETPRMDGQRA